MTSANRPPVSPGNSPLGLPDLIGILCLVTLLLVLSFFRTRHSMFSADEMMTLFVLRQPNYHSLLQAWRFGIDSSGIWFYVFGRPWVSLLGASEVSLRMYSAFGIACSAVVIWITARRYYSFLPVAAAVTFVFASTHVVRWQLAYGRTYGVFMTAAALVIYILFRGEDETGQRPLFLLATFAAYTLLMGSHILGVLYVSAFLATQIALDRRSRRFRPLLYLSAAASVVLLLFSRGNLQTTAALGKPVFWTVPPTLKEIVTLTNLFDHRVTGAIVFVFLVALLHLHLVNKRMSVYFLLLAFAVLNIIFIVRSLFSTSIYVNRYLLPFAFAAILLLCELFTQLREAIAPLKALRHGLPVLFLLLAAAGFFVPRLQRPWFPIPNYTGDLLAALPPHLPIIDTEPASFLEMEFYQHDSLHGRLLYPIDWSVALDPANKQGISGPREIYNLKVEGFHSPDILPTAQILANKRDFAVITSYPDVWLNRRILSDPNFTATKFVSFPLPMGQPLDIWLVHANASTTHVIADVAAP